MAKKRTGECPKARYVHRAEKRKKNKKMYHEAQMKHRSGRGVWSPMKSTKGEERR